MTKSEKIFPVPSAQELVTDAQEGCKAATWQWQDVQEIIAEAGFASESFLMIADRIKELSLEISRLNEVISDYWDESGGNHGKLDLMPDEEKIEIGWKIYWQYPEVKKKSLTKLLGIPVNQIAEKVGPAWRETNCKICSGKTAIKFKNATAAPSPSICKDCQSILAKEEEERSIESHKEWEKRRAEKKAAMAELRSMPYAEYLKTDHWQFIRKQALRKSNYACQVCNAADMTLDVHHRTYERRGCELLSDVTVLCRECHSTHHGHSHQKEAV